MDFIAIFEQAYPRNGDTTDGPLRGQLPQDNDPMNSEPFGMYLKGLFM